MSRLQLLREPYTRDRARSARSKSSRRRKSTGPFPAHTLSAFVSRGLRDRSIASEPMLALGCGALAGPVGLGWIHLQHLTPDVNALLEQAARSTLSVAILSATLRVGWSWARRNLRDLVMILAVGMPAMSGLQALRGGVPG